MKKYIPNSHDTFFKDLIYNKDLAIDFLKNFLPAKILNLIELESLTYLNSSFVDDKQKEAFSDVVLKFKLRNGEDEVFISIIIEHKSYPDKFTSIQLLFYLVNAYRAQLKAKEKLNIVVPVVSLRKQVFLIGGVIKNVKVEASAI